MYILPGEAVYLNRLSDSTERAFCIHLSAAILSADTLSVSLPYAGTNRIK